jgi:hypothetical protein
MIRYSLAMVGPALLVGGALLLSIAVRPFAASRRPGGPGAALESLSF